MLDGFPRLFTVMVCLLSACGGTDISTENDASVGDTGVDAGGPIDSSVSDSSVSDSSVSDSSVSDSGMLNDGSDVPMDAGINLDAELNALCARYAMNECERGVRCNDYPSMTRTECEINQRNGCVMGLQQAFDAVARGEYTLDRTGIDACTAVRPACSSFTTAVEQCRPIFEGTIALSEP